MEQTRAEVTAKCDCGEKFPVQGVSSDPPWIAGGRVVCPDCGKSVSVPVRPEGMDIKKTLAIASAVLVLAGHIKCDKPEIEPYLRLPRPVRDMNKIESTSTRTFSTDTWTNGKSHDGPPPPQFT